MSGFGRDASKRRSTAHTRRLILYGAVALVLVALAGVMLVGTDTAPVASVRAVPTCDDAVRRVQQYPMPPPQTGSLQEALSGMHLLANASSHEIAVTGWEATAGADDCRVSWTYRERGQPKSAYWDWNPTSGELRPLNPLSRTLIGEL
jgi:hypothetical protein